MKKRQNAISYWIMVMPALVWLVLVNIVPMGGVVMAFQDFNPGKGIFRSPWVGLENFQYMLQLKDVQTILINTFTIALFKIIGNLIVPVVFALLLNEISHAMFKRVSQTLVYTIRKEPEYKEFDYPIPKFILQPIIENAIIHGYRDDMHIEVAVRDDEDMVEICISDDGLGISGVQLKRIREYADAHAELGEEYVVGIGLEYVIQSLESFYRKAGKQGAFEIDSRKPVGTTVKIRVPKMQKEREYAEGIDR